MAVTAATTTGDFSGFITPERAGPIFERAAHQSVIQRLVPQTLLGAPGVSIPVVTGRPSVSWVDEGAIKPATSGAMTLKTITPKKLAATFVISAEVVRANPGNYVEFMKKEFADAFASAFDRAAFHDEGSDGTAGAGPFSTYIDQTTKVQEVGGTSVANGGVFVDLKEAMTDIVSDTDSTGRRYRLTGWALDAVLEPVLWGSVDTTGRPIWVDLPADEAAPGISGGRLLGRPSFIGEGVASANLTSVVGYGGDWSQATWGVVGGISYKMSTEAPVTVNGSLVSAFERNLFVCIAEAEYGFLVNDVDAFTKLTNVGNSPVTSS